MLKVKATVFCVCLLTLNTLAHAAVLNETSEVIISSSVHKIDLLGQPWQVVNDGVMGGWSQGTAKANDGVFHFFGNLSTRNNGGFSSIYTDVPLLPSEIDTLKLKVMGDGRDYQVRLRQLVNGYSLNYRATFKTNPNAQEVIIPLSSFQASYRGRVITNAPQIEAQNIRQIGFLANAKTNTDFSLLVQEARFVNSQTNLASAPQTMKQEVEDE